MWLPNLMLNEWPRFTTLFIVSRSSLSIAKRYNKHRKLIIQPVVRNEYKRWRVSSHRLKTIIWVIIAQLVPFKPGVLHRVDHQAWWDNSKEVLAQKRNLISKRRQTRTVLQTSEWLGAGGCWVPYQLVRKWRYTIGICAGFVVGLQMLIESCLLSLLYQSYVDRVPAHWRQGAIV
jgi:hypothetical protein